MRRITLSLVLAFLLLSPALGVSRWSECAGSHGSCFSGAEKAPAPQGDLLAWLRRFRPRAYRFRKPYFAVLAAIFVLTGFVLVRGDGSSVLFGADFREGTQLVVSAGQEENLDSALSSLEEEFPDVPLRKQRLGEPEDGRYLLTLGVAVHPSIGGSQAGGGTLSADEISRILGEDSVKLESLSSIDSRVSSARLLKSLSVTSLSTLVPALTILFVGLGPLEDFARVMILGTVAGTLSSMFVVGSFAVRALEREDRVDGWTAAEKRPVYT